MDRWLKDIDDVTEQVRSHVSGLTPADITWQPSSGVWSVARILEHLIKVSASYGPAIADLRSPSLRMPVTAKIPGLPALLGAMILSSVAPESRRRSRTLPLWDPPAGGGEAAIVGEFVRSQDDLKLLLTRSEDLLARGAIVCSPANRMIVYPLSTAFDIIVRHEQRHLGQIVRTIAQRRGAA